MSNVQRGRNPKSEIRSAFAQKQERRDKRKEDKAEARNRKSEGRPFMWRFAVGSRFCEGSAAQPNPFVERLEWVGVGWSVKV